MRAWSQFVRGQAAQRFARISAIGLALDADRREADGEPWHVLAGHRWVVGPKGLVIQGWPWPGLTHDEFR